MKEVSTDTIKKKDRYKDRKRGQRTKGRELRAEGRGQRAENREQRAESREHLEQKLQLGNGRHILGSRQ
jgi:hypothetical protein